jgi:hypothetical protein
MGGITRGSLVSPKNSETTPEECAGAVQKIPGPTFLKLRPNGTNSSDQSLNDFLIKFTVYSLLFRQKVGMNATFNIKKNAVKNVFTSDFCILAS